jgi:drug/metabolite transporter (DMT)-like permease
LFNPPRKALDGIGMSLMLMLCICWGLQQVAVKVAAPSINPVAQMAVRSLVAAALVAQLMARQRTSFSVRDGTLWPGVWAGVLFGAEFLCISVGLTYTSASHMVMFLYTAPIFTVLGLQWRVRGESLQPQQWAGIVLAFLGIAFAFSNGLAQHGPHAAESRIGDVLGVIAGALWGATTVLIRGSVLSETAPSKTLLYQLVVSGVLLMFIALAAGYVRQIEMTHIAWASLLFQSVVVSFASYLAWFWILRRYLASRVSVFAFLTPLFGVLFGVLLLDEPFSARFAVGAALVLAGIVLVNHRR